MAESEATTQFRELQKSYMETSSKLKQVAVQGRQREQERQRCILTLSELEPLPDSVNTFKGLGRAFLQTPKPSLETELREAVTDCDGELEKLKSSKEYLEKQAQDVEKNIKELLKTNESLARQIMMQ